MIDFLNHLSQVTQNFSSSEVAGSLAVILGIGIRVVPSQKPACLLLYVGNGLHALGNFVTAVSGAFDKIVPQNIVPPKA